MEVAGANHGGDPREIARARARMKISRGKLAWRVKCAVATARMQHARELVAEQSAEARRRAGRAKVLQQRRASASRARNREARARAKQASQGPTARARARQAASR